jgi:hypothetical protein
MPFVLLAIYPEAPPLLRIVEWVSPRQGRRQAFQFVFVEWVALVPRQGWEEAVPIVRDRPARRLIHHPNTTMVKSLLRGQLAGIRRALSSALRP